ncbi:MAG TPA: PAAR domain-containing protein [Candidatus Limnocylindria bacterium]|nr:PAAR domain-containing protein [Candidatus Limnocylindria bacterium]
MGQPAAKMGDQVVGADTHLVQPPGPTPPVPVPLPFAGTINGGLSSNVFINGMPAATLGSTATNLPPHIPPGGTFVNPPTNQATIISGSPIVMINGKPAARAGDTAITCNDPAPLPVGTVVAVSNVLIA